MSSPLQSFVAGVSALGVLVTAGLVWQDGGMLLGDLDAVVLLFAAAILIAEFFPLDIPGREGQATFSTTFAFALLLAEGTAAVVVAHTLTVMLADMVRRREAGKALFNGGQYALSWLAAGAVLHWLTGPLPDNGGLEYLELAHLPALGGAAVAFLLVNTALASTPPALSDGASPFAYMGSDFGFQATVTLVLVALVPSVLVVAAYDPVLIPILWLPLAALQRGGRQAVLNAHQAMHDPLTGLPNRSQLNRRLADALVAARSQRRHVGVLVLDLDGFKDVNDTFGHQHGDLLLEQVAGRLMAGARGDHVVARLGGDEFAVVLTEAGGTADCVATATDILGRLEGTITLEGVELDLRASVGISCFPEHGADADALLRRADIAMYKAKDGRSGWAVYDSGFDEHTPKRLSLISDLRGAVERDELLLEYQPKLDLASGRVSGVEALVRWSHPQRGLVAPGEFVGLAEHTGFIRPLTMWVARTALLQAQQWRREGLDVRVAVNISARSLTPELPGSLAALLAELGATGSELTLEITETTMMSDPDEALEVLHALAALGLGVSVDDFGTGYSSLSYLKRLPVAELKIDRTFVRDMDADAGDHGIVRSTIELAHHLGLKVVAEGVESAAVLDELRQLGCDHAQGYFISRPLSAAELSDWARSGLGELSAATRPRALPSLSRAVRS